MKKNHILTTLIAATFISGMGINLANAESYPVNTKQQGKALLTPKAMDELNSAEQYWSKSTKIETAKASALQLKIQNFALLNKSKEQESSSIGDINYKNKKNIDNLKAFLKEGMSEEKVLNPINAEMQESIIGKFADDPMAKIDVSQKIDSDGNVINNNKNNIADEVSKKIIKEQQAFMKQLSDFLSNNIQSKQNNDVSEVEGKASIQQVEAQRQPSASFQYQAIDEIERFERGVGRIKKITPNGMQIVMAYKLRDEDADTALIFATADIKNGDKEVIFYPLIRYAKSYKIKQFSPEKIILTDSDGEDIVVVK